MNKKRNVKPLTIKEYTRNYKFPDNIPKISQESDYIHKTQNIFLSKILKNKKIPNNEDINKTIENLFQKRGNRERVFNIFKKRNNKIANTSNKLPITKINKRDKSHESLSVDKIKEAKKLNFNSPIKNHNKINSVEKRHIEGTATPFFNKANNGITNEPDKCNKTMIKEKNENNNSDIYLLKNKQLNKYNKDIHYKTEANQVKYDYNKNKDNINKKKNNGKKSFKKIPIKISRKNNDLKTRKKISFNPEKSEEIVLNEEKENGSSFSGYLLYKLNLGKIVEKIELDKDEDKLKKIFLNIINETAEEENVFITKNKLDLINVIKEENDIKNKIIKDQEILIEQIKKTNLDLNNEFNKLTKENKELKEKLDLLEKEKEDIEKLNKSFNEYKEQAKKEIQILEKQLNKYDNEIKQEKIERKIIKEYSIEKFDIFINKKINNINKGIKIEKYTIEKSELFIEKKVENVNIIKDYDIWKFDIFIEKAINNKNIIKDFKIEKFDVFIDKKIKNINKKKDYLIEKFNLFIDKKVNEINKGNVIKEYNLEKFDIFIEKNKNKIKEYRIDKYEIYIQKNKHNIIEFDKKDDKAKKERAEKISRILNKIGRKKPNENKNEDDKIIKKDYNTVIINKSQKINSIANLLEKQLSGKLDNNENVDIKEEKESENKDLNFMKLTEGKSLNINKRKKKSRIIFEDEL